jgi:signal transduction histidine kinase
MRTRRTILLLAGLTFIMVIVLMIWQLSSLQGLRMQIAAGLHGSLQKIANSTARQLQQDYIGEMDKGMNRLMATVRPDGFKEPNLPVLRKPFLMATAAQPLCNAWVIAFPMSDGNRFRVWEYKSPNRYRRGDKNLGGWRDQTELTAFIRSEMDNMAAPYGSIEKMSKTIWSSALDSNLVLTYNKAFNSNTLIGSPVFGSRGDLRCLVFRQTDPRHFQKVYLRDFFHLRFWPDDKPMEGLEKRFLQFGLLKGQGGQLIYHSVAYGQPTFEHEAQLASFGPWLGDLRLGVSFREANVEEVTQSIYRRNLYLILTLFSILTCVLLLLVRAAMRLFRLSRLKTEFVANVSHEIKTPLATIRLAADSLRLHRLKDPESIQRVVGMIDAEAERLNDLIHSLLDFSQLEAGRKKYNRKTISVLELWDTLSVFAKHQAGGHLELAPGNLPNGTVKVDAKAIVQSLAILIDNARKYGQGDQKLTFGSSTRKNRVCFDVRDYGPGIAAKDQKIIFEKFVRIGNVEEHNVKGHGIGLSIARAIIVAHGGSLELKSAPGEGATFSICLPCNQEIVQ